MTDRIRGLTPLWCRKIEIALRSQQMFGSPKTQAFWQLAQTRLAAVSLANSNQSIDIFYAWHYNKQTPKCRGWNLTELRLCLVRSSQHGTGYTTFWCFERESNKGGPCQRLEWMNESSLLILHDSKWPLLIEKGAMLSWHHLSAGWVKGAMEKMVAQLSSQAIVL